MKFKLIFKALDEAVTILFALVVLGCLTYAVIGWHNGMRLTILTPTTSTGFGILIYVEK